MLSLFALFFTLFLAGFTAAQGPTTNFNSSEINQIISEVPLTTRSKFWEIQWRRGCTNSTTQTPGVPAKSLFAVTFAVESRLRIHAIRWAYFGSDYFLDVVLIVRSSIDHTHCELYLLEQQQLTRSSILPRLSHLLHLQSRPG